jgi:hypothetical protein
MLEQAHDLGANGAHQNSGDESGHGEESTTCFEQVRRDQIPLYLIYEHETKFMFRGEAARPEEIAIAFVDDGLRGSQFLWDESNMNNRDVEVR